MAALRWLAAVAAVLGFAVAGGWAQPAPIGAPMSGLIEAGVPSFVVLGPEALGLATAPVDLQRMPDGRLLAVGQGELALGDGVRWEVFREIDGGVRANTQTVAVDDAGLIYAGVPGGFARIEFESNGRWRFVRAGKLPEGLQADHGIPVYASVVNGQWFWWWGSGPILAWKPGTAARLVGETNAPERAFVLGGEIHLSDFSTGALFRFVDGAFQPVPLPATAFVEQLVTCAVPLREGADLVGTNRRGVLVRDRGDLRPLVTRGPLSGEHRINDLCVTDGGFFAAAVDNLGIVFFDGTGRIVQVLDRSVDHRLSRVKRLLRTPGAGLWALLSEGVAHVAFPARVSNFEPLIPTGLSFAQPYRFQGRLWVVADGRAQRAVYDAGGRLTHFEFDSPEPFVASLAEVGGDWLATTRGGIYRRDSAGHWTLVADGPNNAQIRLEPVEPGCWFYAAHNEVGWLRRDGARFSNERLLFSDLGDVYGLVADASGVIWLELGRAKVARVEPTRPRPTVRVYGTASGLPSGWAQTLLLAGQARVNVLGRILKFDSAADRFVPDEELLRRFPMLAGAHGRPTFDAAGRLWVSHEQHVQVIAPGTAPEGSEERIPDGLTPWSFTAQPDGVMWMHEQSRLARFDPQVPVAATPRLRALITRVQLLASNRELFSVGSELPPLAAEDNSLVVHFLAPDSPVGRPVTFDVKLEGSGGGWISAGASGSATFNHLGQGRYAVLVRPRQGDRVGEEARLGLVVLAAWYRTRTAYAAYAVGVLAVFVLVGRFSAYHERREKARLERIVALRTRELHQTNQELGRQVQASLEKTDALQTSEDRYRRLSENAPDIIFRIRLGPPVAYDYLSPAIERVTGYAPREFYADVTLGTRIAEPPLTRTIQEIAASGRLPAGVRETRITARDGRFVTLEQRLVPVFDREGRLVALEGIARDITDRKRVEQEIRRLSQAVEQSPAGVYITDLTGGIVFANPRMSELTGYSTPELLTQNLRDLCSELVRPGLYEEIWTTVSGGGSWHGQIAMPGKDGRVLHVRAAISPLRGPDGAIVNYLALKEDITQSVEDQARQRRLEAQLFQAQKLESLGTLAGGIAHDFNNILTGILGYCELAALSAAADPALQADLAEIRGAGLRAKELVAQILTFSRRGESRLATVDLATIVAEALKLVRASTPATIEIVRELDSGLIEADVTQIHQIVLNLCTNSLHAMREQPGRLTVTVQPVSVDAALAAEIANLSPGAWMRLSVRDTGCGMDNATIARIFDPFFTTKNPGEGTGLGLSIVQGIVASHHGAVRVQSAVGGGTTFELYFPVANRTVVPSLAAIPAPRGQGREILVIDDEPSVANFAAARLEHFDYRVTVFYDPREALAAFERDPQRFHVLVTDLTMPHLTGVELVRRVRAGGRIIPAVIMSGFGKELAMITPETVPCAVVLTKPFGGEELVRAVDRVLEING